MSLQPLHDMNDVLLLPGEYLTAVVRTRSPAEEAAAAGGTAAALAATPCASATLHTRRDVRSWESMPLASHADSFLIEDVRAAQVSNSMRAANAWGFPL